MVHTSASYSFNIFLLNFYYRVLEAGSKLGGEDLIPFYGLLEGGREGELFKELENYFYYAQIRRCVYAQCMTTTFGQKTIDQSITRC